MKTELPPAGGELAAMLDRSPYITRDGLTDTRRALKALRADTLDDLGLPLAIRNMAEVAADRAGVRLELEIGEHIPALQPSVEQEIFRIAQEATENAVHHAGSSILRVGLRVREEALELAVSDDGSGFDPQRVNDGNHLGILGMRERAEACGGTLTIDSRKEEGTTLLLRVPIAYDPRSHL